MQKDNCFVLIRGLLREARHWGEFTDDLRQRFPNARILTPDLPGNGRLHRLTSPNTIAAMTEALREQIKVGIPVDLIALSMGGMVAIDWMARYPDEIRSSVLINTSARPLSPFYRRLRWQSYPRLISMLCHSKQQQEQDILSLTSNRHRGDSELLSNWRQWQRQCPVTSYSARNQLRAAANFTLPPRPPHPMLIVASGGDRLVDCRCSRQLYQAWRTDYRQHDTAGHDLALDEPAWLADSIKQWLSIH
ncbi:alpha/beta hydrolase [Methylomarinum sp. Ch1-1]|uniref:Alpha/beta hydrolase n=1 Tax=Methylomarinum roseum TaxID=3067653 RepID=A0AAU7NUF4_9GAMM|nr:alpha/beta hydrolase [Methylomarinum sp. Ch1-1]MDP4519726.1 alpha/beta hydrolase [Methylomarinum sp. Ch1-1]